MSETEYNEEESETGDEAPDLNEWLEEKPSIAGAIFWENKKGAVSYSKWDDDKKESLQEIFASVWNEETVFEEDPVPNKAKLKKGDEVVQTMDEDLAWNIFASYLSQSLAMEIKEKLEWSLEDMSAQGLAELLDGRKMFVYDSEKNEYSIDYRFGYVVYCDPVTALQFLKENKIIKTKTTDSIAAMMEWCRKHLQHFSGGDDLENLYDQWQYKGFPPLIRMIEGTVQLSDPDSGKMHITYGCWGTTGFLKAILRIINIPVELVIAAGHAIPRFVEEKLYLSHGDDLYNQLAFADPPIPIDKFLIEEEKFKKWFSGSDEENDKNIGRQVLELAIEYLPTCLLIDFGEDMEEEKDHSNGAVYQHFKNMYSVEALEKKGLWKKLNQRVYGKDE